MPDTRDIPLDTRPRKMLAELHYIYVAAAHRGGGGAGTKLFAAVERDCVARSCTHIELVADSLAAEDLLRFYNQACGMSYMFTRLRKEIAPATEGLPPQPIPYLPSARGPGSSGATSGDMVELVDWTQSFCTMNSPTLGTASTARFHLDAACTVRTPGASATQFWLTNPCIGENMYRDNDLIDLPPGELSVVFEAEGQFIFDKRFADRQKDTRMVRRVGEQLSLRPGVSASLSHITPRIAHHRSDSVREVSSYADIRAAILCEPPYTGVIVGRTTCHLGTGDVEEAQATIVELEYPIKTVNVANDKEMWQMDAGPLCLPLVGGKAAAALSRHEPAGLGVGYLVFNRLCAEDGGPDLIDAVARPVPPYTKEATDSQTYGASFFSESFSLRGCRTRLFALISTGRAAL